MPFLKFIRKIDLGISWAESVSLVSILGFMALLAFFQVFCRNFFNFGFAWGDEVLRHLVVWVGLIGASLGIRDDRSIRIDVINRLFPPRINKYSEGLLNLIGAIVSILLILASLKFLQMEKEYNEVFSSLRIPVWKVLVIYPISFGVISLRFILNGISYLLGELIKEQNQ
ncbi:MAG: TRAP transporter small permease [bacterium]|nr:TRAP transporter small permease [bacterium]